MTKQSNWTVVVEAILLVKSIEPEQVRLDSYIGNDLGIDSIGVVDLWFELKKLIKNDSKLNSFYKHIRADTQREFYNDFTVRELAEYLKLKI